MPKLNAVYFVLILRVNCHVPQGSLLYRLAGLSRDGCPSFPPTQNTKLHHLLPYMQRYFNSTRYMYKGANHFNW